MRGNTPFKYIMVILIASIFSVRALFHSGLPPTHDGEYHVIRFYEFYKALDEGAIYPRWASDLNLGMGAPLFNYVYPLPNYFSALAHLLGASFIDAFKLNFIGATIVGGVSMYFFSRLYFKEIGGVLSSIFYIFAPYRFLDIYIRGSVGEVWALSFLPAFMWAITKLFQEGKSVYVGLSAVFLALVIFSHNILALMFFLFSLFYLAVLIFKSKNPKPRLPSILLSYALGLGLSGIFWIPALLEKKYVRGLDVFDLKGNFPEIFQLLIPSWGSGFSGGNLAGQMSFQIGLANLLIIFISLLIFFKLRKMRREIIFFLTSFFIVFFLMTKTSLFIWENIPLFNYFQFPWRLLSLEIFITAVLAGFVWRTVSEAKIKGRIKTFILLALLFLPVFLALDYSKPAYYHQRDDSYYINRPNFISGTNSPGNLFNTVWAKEIEKINDFRIVEGEGALNVYKNSSTDYEIKSKSEDKLIVLTNLMHFPGWSLKSEEETMKIRPSKNGQIEFELPKGENVFYLKLKNTNIQNIGAFLTALSIIFLAFISIKGNYTIIKR